MLGLINTNTIVIEQKTSIRTHQALDQTPLDTTLICSPHNLQMTNSFSGYEKQCPRLL